MEKISEFLRQFGWVVLVGLVGLVGLGIIIYGLWGVVMPEKSVVEIVKVGTESSDHSLAQGSELGEVTVDVAGAVEKPGVYKLPDGSRIGDALVVAGGLAEKADREWVSKTVNLAEVVKDGGKIYIPAVQHISDSAGRLSSVSVSQTGKININTASVAELDRLVGIGEVRAQAIVDNRPYGNVEELVSKAKVPESVFEKIKDQVSVY